MIVRVVRAVIVRVVRAVIVAVVVGLICYLVGALLGVTNVAPLEVVGGFLVRFCWVLGLLAGVWYFLGGRLTV